MTNKLEHIVEEAVFESLQKALPPLVELIKELLDAGASPDSVEVIVSCIPGCNGAISTMAGLTAVYLQRKEVEREGEAGVTGHDAGSGASTSP